ncbi:MAG: hypothetical protein BWK79_17175, partial [Beggiatoa sp. IS2]
GDQLPIIFILIDLLVMVGSILYAHYTQKFSGLAILGFFFIATAGFAILMQTLFFLNEYQMVSLKFIYGFFFVGFFFFYILIFIHIGSVIASHFTAVQIKRVTGVINTGIPIGGALGGITLVTLLNFFHIKPQSLIIVLAIACLVAFWLLRIIESRLSPVRAGTAEFRSHKTPLQELFVAFKYIIGSQLMIFMSLGLIVFVIGSKLLEYEYQAIIYPNIFPGTTHRATFFATYEIFANFAWLLIQLFLTSRIVVNLGVGASNLVYPILSATASLALFLYFYLKSTEYIQGSELIMLTLGIFTHFINQEMRGALRTPVSNLLFNAIPPNLWGTNKAFINGIVFPLSTILVSIFLILMTRSHSIKEVEQLSYLLPLIALIVSLLGILIALPQWVAYNKGMFGLLSRELFDSRMDIRTTHKIEGLKQAVEEKLNSSDPYHIIGALEMIRLLKIEHFSPYIGQLLLKSKSYEIKRHCLSTLAVFPRSNAILTYLLGALVVEEDYQTLSLILKNLAGYSTTDFCGEVERFLGHPAPEVFVTASLCLYHHPLYQRKQNIERKILARLMGDSNSPHFSLYLYALGELQQTQYHEVVLPFLESSHVDVRIAAFTAYLRILADQLDSYQPQLLIALNSPIKEIKIIALQALKKCRPLAQWDTVIQLLSDKDRTLVNESKALLRIHLPTCQPILLTYLFSDKISTQQRFEVLSLVYHQLNNKQHLQLQQDAHKSLKRFVRIQWLLKLHQSKTKSSKTHPLIAKVLQEVAEDYLSHVLTVITYLSGKNQEFFQRVNRGLLSTSRANQGNALEVLSNSGEKILTNKVLRYFEERINDIQCFNRIYLALFSEVLSVAETHYDSLLQALEHDMIKACLSYIEFEKNGDLNLAIHDKKVVELLTGVPTLVRNPMDLRN